MILIVSMYFFSIAAKYFSKTVDVDNKMLPVPKDSGFTPRVKVIQYTGLTDTECQTQRRRMSFWWGLKADFYKIPLY